MGFLNREDDDLKKVLRHDRDTRTSSETGGEISVKSSTLTCPATSLRQTSAGFLPEYFTLFIQCEPGEIAGDDVC
jgi:hypothetical protein